MPQIGGGGSIVLAINITITLGCIHRTVVVHQLYLLPTAAAPAVARDSIMGPSPGAPGGFKRWVQAVSDGVILQGKEVEGLQSQVSGFIRC